MKPIFLEFDGINCFFEKQTIDFEKLSKTGIFGIFGPTGSGKSTILDAMTLALFGETTRSKGKGDFVNTKKQKAEVLFRFESGKIFEVSRTYAIKKSGLVDSTAILTCDGNVVAEGVRDTDAKIFEVTGLTMSDFSKCVALPQGRFADFLQAKPAERTSLVGNLFGLEKYGDELGRKANTKKMILSQELGFLDKQLAEFGTNTNQEILELKSFEEQTKKQIEENQKELEHLKEQQTKFEAQKQLFEKKQALKKQMQALERKQDEILQKKQKLEKQKQLEAHKGNIERYLELQEKQKTVDKSFLDIEKQFKLANIDLESAKREHEAASKKVLTVSNSDQEIAVLLDAKQTEAQLQKQMQEKAELEKDCLRLEEQILQTNDTTSKKQDELLVVDKKIETGSNEVLALDKELESLLNVQAGISLGKNKETLMLVLKELEKHYESLETSATAKTKDISKRNRLVSSQKLKIAEVLQKLGTKEDLELLSTVFKDKVSKMQTAKEKLLWLEEELSLCNEEKNQQQTKNNFDSAEIEGKKAEVSNIEKTEADLAQQIRTLESERDHALLDNAESTVASETVLGTGCPICGSTVSRIYPPRNTSIANVNHSLVLAKKQLENLKTQKFSIIQQIAKLEERIEQRNLLAKNLEKKADLLQSKTNKVLIGFVDIGKNAKDNFNSLFETTQKQFSAIEEALIKTKKQKAQIEEIEKKNVEDGFSLIRDKESLAILRSYIEEVQKLIAENQFEILSNKQLSAKEVEEERKRVKGLLEATNKNQTLLQNQKIELLSTISSLSEKKKFLNDAFCTNKQKIDELQKQIEVASKEISQLHRGYSSISDKIDKLQSAKESILNENAAATKKLELSTSTYLELQPKYIELQKEKENTAENLFALSSTLLPVAKKLGIQLSELCAMAKEQDQNLEAEIEMFDTQRNVIISQLKELENAKIENVEDPSPKQREIEEQTSQLRLQLGAATEKIAAKLENAKKIEKLSEERKQVSKKLDVFSKLCSLLRGKELLAFAAEEYLQEITLSASEKLFELMDGRYSLVYENKDFFVIDNLSGGKKRSASTLSGGETFVVSLSLAIAIAESILRLSAKSTDFFFLDEGFGSLDNELRDTILSSLVKLKESGLVIGLISHVDSLKEEITTRLEIERKTNKNGEISSTITFEEDI